MHILIIRIQNLSCISNILVKIDKNFDWLYEYLRLSVHWQFQLLCLEFILGGVLQQIKLVISHESHSQNGPNYEQLPFVTLWATTSERLFYDEQF